MNSDYQQRHEREMQSTLEQIKAFQHKKRAGWRLEIPVWKLAVEGLCLFMLAFLMGLGFAVLYEIVNK